MSTHGENVLLCFTPREQLEACIRILCAGLKQWKGVQVDSCFSLTVKCESVVSFLEDPAEARGFMDKLTDTILNNIQVSIKGIHIRYEDKMTNPEHPFACGIMLKGLSAETTNNQWQPVQVDGDATEVNKVISNLCNKNIL